MADGRPVELAVYIEAATEKNDVLILDALSKLEDNKTRGKLKATVASLCLLTSLSRNTIRNRGWALDRLKAIKRRLKGGEEAADGVIRVQESGDAILSGLRKRIRDILDQNALLYEEILSLRQVIERKDRVIRELTARNR